MIRNINNIKRNAGFSLMELLVVVGIVGVIMGIAFTGYIGMLNQASSSQMKNTMGALNAVAAKYELKTKKPIDTFAGMGRRASWWDRTADASVKIRKNVVKLPEHPKNHEDFLRGNLTPEEKIENASQNTEYFDNNAKCELANLLSERFVWQVLRMPETKDMVNNAAKHFLVDIDVDEETGDGFLEIRDPWNQCVLYVFEPHQRNTEGINLYWLPNRSNPYFASAGPDGYWGIDPNSPAFESLSGDEKLLARKLSSDNIYSFELDKAAN
ncbi:hypothetical protein KS4_19890 [Poriferisphaera corsica]|uniref:Type II secretion system protein n=1 Tax=Poriferisphaera corsica TaxID=2528020 RepID=A0A517YUK7_9BACT|nr:prepilin-type N-terminal cleavage/methylation domain-containing protein [Poriferisphaera corsica]QDU33929.1 hypothetical protein KS4_19890 [Poriferisphaera corsica]